MPITLVGDEAGLTLDHPIIGWHNLVTSSNVTATSSATNYPISNVGNPATHLKWQATTSAPQTITAVFPATSMDYVAIAVHNLFTQQKTVTVDGNISGSPDTFFNLVPAAIPASNGPQIYRFTEQTLVAIRVTIGTAGSPDVGAEIAVLYAGKLLVLPRKIFQNQIPINYARVSKATNGKSEAGQFLGRVVTQEYQQTKVPLLLIPQDYYRTNVDGLLNACSDTPFFIAWRPLTYPNEIGYAFMTNDPMPVNDAPHGLIAMTLEMTGII